VLPPPPGPLSVSVEHLAPSHEGSLSLNPDLLALAAEIEMLPTWFVVPSECLLRTRALACDADGIVAGGRGDNARALGPVTMCCHFATKHSCDRGVRCKYAHVLPAAYAHHLHHRPRARAPIHGQNVVSHPLGVGSVESAPETNGTCAATLGETTAVDAHAAGSAPQSSSRRSGGGVFQHDPYSAAPRYVS